MATRIGTSGEEPPLSLDGAELTGWPTVGCVLPAEPLSGLP
jgi:hypothetical protein